MSWRVVVVSSSAKVDYKADYLVVRTVDKTERVHIGEIGVLILESTAVSVTAYLLYALTEHKVQVLFCDPQRNPYAELLPLHGSHDSSAKIRQQIAWPEPVKQEIWTELIRQKIYRQRNHLLHRNRPEAELLTQYLTQLTFNDSTNREGHAAKVYFNALFGPEFTRSGTDPVNAALNYGYSLILSAINREIAASGYLNQLGLHHENTYNPYNLACDLIEPLRPLVDRLVYDIQPQKLEKEEKTMLLKLFQQTVTFDGKTQYLLYAIRLYCGSLFRALQSKDIAEIRWIEYER